MLKIAWIIHVFEGHEFLVAGSNHDCIKRLLVQLLVRRLPTIIRLQNYLKIKPLLIEQTVSQVTVMDSQWFVFN